MLVDATQCSNCVLQPVLMRHRSNPARASSPSFPFIVAFLCGDKLDLCVGCAGVHTAVPYLVFEQEWEGFLEGLAETGPHETVYKRIDRGVGIRHTVGPGLNLVSGISGLEVWVERLEEDKDLDGTPADGEKQDDDHHHFRDLAPDGNGSFREQVNLGEKK